MHTGISGHKQGIPISLRIFQFVMIRTVKGFSIVNEAEVDVFSGISFLFQCMKVKSEREVAQSCPTLSDPMDCSPPGSSIHGIFQARVLEWVAIAFSD